MPAHRPTLAGIRLLAAAGIAAIAAWVSYWHMTGVAARYGETGTSPYLLPLSVDGLIVVASVSLVELAGRIRHLEADTPTRAGGEQASGSDPAADDVAPAAPAVPGRRAAAPGPGRVGLVPITSGTLQRPGRPS